jgi:hypothetical protein
MATMRHGVAPELEAIADALIKQSLVGITKYSDKSDILTPWKYHMRRSREVLTNTGTADPSIRNGMYHRALNQTRPWLNSREGNAARGRSMGVQGDHPTIRMTSSLLGFVEDDGG